MNKNSRELNKCIRGLFDEGIDKFYKRVNNGGLLIVLDIIMSCVMDIR